MGEELEITLDKSFTVHGTRESVEPPGCNSRGSSLGSLRVSD